MSKKNVSINYNSDQKQAYQRKKVNYFMPYIIILRYLKMMTDIKSQIVAPQKKNRAIVLLRFWSHTSGISLEGVGQFLRDTGIGQ